MCNPTSQPPRRDLYELETILTADNGGFLVAKRPRIGTSDKSGRIEVYNACWSATGQRIGNYERPWNVFTPWDSIMFATHAEAIAYAFSQVPEKKEAA